MELLPNQTRAVLFAFALLPGVTAACSDDRTDAQSGGFQGEQILFASDMDGDWEIFAMRPDGSSLRRRTHNMARDISAAWSPDGKRMVFSSNYLEGGLQTAMQEVGVGEFGIVDVEVVGDSELRVADIDDLVSTAVTDNASATDGSPDWSPDGSRIAFHSDLEEGGVFEIYSMRPDGTDLNRLTDLGEMNWDPSWSSDGQNIVFAHFSEHWTLYSVTADGTQVTELNEAGDGWQPAWSPAGNQIAFSSQREGLWNIYTVDVGGGNLLQLTTNVGDNLEPVWSPTGDQIAFTSNRAGPFKVFVMDSDGGNITSTGRTGIPSDWLAVP